MPPVIDFRQSGDPHPIDDMNPDTPAPQPETVETNQGVPYGTKLITTLGAPNYITGDFNKDGYVNTADYVVWRKTSGQTGNESNHPLADSNHDFLVTNADLDLWIANFGSPNTSAADGASGASTLIVPEPRSWAASTIFLLGLSMLRDTRRSRMVMTYAPPHWKNKTRPTSYLAPQYSITSKSYNVARTFNSARGFGPIR
jgi:hypothetical protein